MPSLGRSWHAIVAACLVGAVVLSAQTTGGSPVSQARTVDGRVLRGTPSGEKPLGGQVVVLHRIASDSAGPVDSVRTAQDGRYRFRYRAAEDSVLYIVSARYAGVAYFTAPLRAAAVRGSDADIVVFDTTSAPIALSVRGRHFVVTRSPNGGVRRAVDVFEIANDTSVTRISGPATPSWSVRLPDGATTPRVEQGDVPAGAVSFVGGVAEVFAPFPPGLKQVVFSYELPATAFPARIPVESPTGVLEVLLQESGARVDAPALARQDSVTLQGTSYQRYLGQNLPAGSPVRIVLESSASGGRLLTGAMVLLSGALLALGFRAGRIRGTSLPARRGRPDTAALARDIATLDAAFESQGDRSEASRTAYQRRRAELKSQLVQALAAVESADRGR